MSHDDDEIPQADRFDDLFHPDEVVAGSVRPPEGDAAFQARSGTRKLPSKRELGGGSSSELEIDDLGEPRFVGKHLEHNVRSQIPSAPDPSPSKLRTTVAFVVAAVVAGGLYWWSMESDASEDGPTPGVTEPQGSEQTGAGSRRSTGSELTELSVITVPSGAAVFRGEERLGETPFTTRDLSPGTYELTIRHEGYRELRVSTVISTGDSTLVQETLTAERRYDESRTGTISITTEPTAEAFFQGRALGTTPLSQQVLPAGVVELEFVLPGGERLLRNVVVVENETTAVSLSLQAM